MLTFLRSNAADVERERGRRAYLNKESLGADRDVVSRRACRSHGRCGDNRNEFDFLECFL